MRRPRNVLVLVALAASLLVACKTHKTKRGFRIGTGCEKMDESCSNGSTGNVCLQDVLTSVSCKGPKGCVDALPDDVECDQTIAEQNDACAGDALACSSARDTLLECKNGVFAKKSGCPSRICTITVEGVAGFKMTSTDCR